MQEWLCVKFQMFFTKVSLLPRIAISVIRHVLVFNNESLSIDLDDVVRLDPHCFSGGCLVQLKQSSSLKPTV